METKYLLRIGYECSFIQGGEYWLVSDSKTPDLPLLSEGSHRCQRYIESQHCDEDPDNDCDRRARVLEIRPYILKEATRLAARSLEGATCVVC